MSDDVPYDIQHAHSTRGGAFESHGRPEFVVVNLCESLRQYIRNLVLRRNIVEIYDDAGCKFLANETVMNLDMFGSPMERRISCESDSGLVVDEEWSGSGDIFTKVREELTELYGFSCALSSSHIFAFSA
jgi:hypothetical protein